MNYFLLFFISATLNLSAMEQAPTYGKYPTIDSVPIYCTHLAEKVSIEPQIVNHQDGALLDFLIKKSIVYLGTKNAWFICRKTDE